MSKQKQLVSIYVLFCCVPFFYGGKYFHLADFDLLDWFQFILDIYMHRITA